MAQSKNAALEERVDTLQPDLAALRAQVARQPATAEKISAKRHDIERRLEAIEQSAHAPNAMLFRTPETEGVSPTLHQALSQIPSWRRAVFVR